MVADQSQAARRDMTENLSSLTVLAISLVKLIDQNYFYFQRWSGALDTIWIDTSRFHNYSSVQKNRGQEKVYISWMVCFHWPVPITQCCIFFFLNGRLLAAFWNNLEETWLAETTVYHNLFPSLDFSVCKCSYGENKTRFQ